MLTIYLKEKCKKKILLKTTSFCMKLVTKKCCYSLKSIFLANFEQIFMFMEFSCLKGLSPILHNYLSPPRARLITYRANNSYYGFLHTEEKAKNEAVNGPQGKNSSFHDVFF